MLLIRPNGSRVEQGQSIGELCLSNGAKLVYQQIETDQNLHNDFGPTPKLSRRPPPLRGTNESLTAGLLQRNVGPRGFIN